MKKFLTTALAVGVFALSACGASESPATMGENPPILATAPQEPVEPQTPQTSAESPTEEPTNPTAENTATNADSPLVGRWRRTDDTWIPLTMEFFADGSGTETHGPDFDEWIIHFNWDYSDGRLRMGHTKDFGSYQLTPDGAMINRGSIVEAFVWLDPARRIHQSGRNQISPLQLARRLDDTHEGLQLAGIWEGFRTAAPSAVFNIELHPDGRGLESSSNGDFFFMWESDEEIPNTYNRQLTRIFSEILESEIDYSLADGVLTLFGDGQTITFARLGN
ncbi:MAG: hypothetical protein FWG65_02810 [Turicibacter sp.]|nr:hypothetical protein [Turicibacter sp.]